jgi:hypothetical protein
VDGHAHDGGFRGTVIPAQVGAVHHDQNGRDSQDAHAHDDEQPVEGRAPHGLSPGKLQIDNLQLFREGFDLIRLYLRHRLAQQGAHGSLQGLRQDDEQIGIRDGQSLLPF